MSSDPSTDAAAFDVAPGARIVRLVDYPDRAAAESQIEQIFFDAAERREFGSKAERAAFRERWLGRYFGEDARRAWVAALRTSAGGVGDVIGYVVGSHEDPARTARFSDIPYFANFAEVTARYPAHLHINLAASARSRGIGSRLVDAFVADVAAAGLPGVHVVTGRASRNVGFYVRLGFLERATADYHGNAVVMLGRDL